MLDNFMTQYHSYDEVFRVPGGHSIFLGDMQAAQDFDFLQQQQIRTVVTAARDMPQLVFSPSVRHVVYPLLDGKQQDISAFFGHFYELVQQGLTKGSILVHCAAGISRSPTLVISYLMKRDNLSFREAIAFVRKSRPAVLPNLGFEQQLKQYEAVLRRAPLSRSSRRSQVRTCESGKSRSSANNAALPLMGRPKLEQLSEKEIRIFRVYNQGKMQRESKKQLLLRRWGRGEGNRREVARSMHEPEGQRLVPVVRPVRRNLAERLKTLHETEFGPN